MKLNHLVLSLLVLFTLTLKAQTNSVDVLRNQIVKFESVNTTTMSQAVSEIYKSELLRLYDEYVKLLDQEINSIANLEKISDPEGKFAKERSEAEKERTWTQNKTNTLRENLTNNRTTAKPAEKDKPTTVSEEKKAPKEKPKTETAENKSDKVSFQPISKVETKMNSFPNAPPSLKNQAQTLAKAIVSDINSGESKPVESQVSSEYPLIFSLSTVSGIAIEQAKNPIFDLEPIRFLVETARTDKQLSASSSTAASTSAIDKPGFAGLLGFAIDNGFIEKNVQDTVLTLSTSPSTLFSLSEKNPTQAYQNAGVFNKIGLSASFNINSDHPLLANATRSQLREYSIRYRFYGDRSSRSKELDKIWREKIAPIFAEMAKAINTGNITVDDDGVLSEARKQTEKNLTDLLNERVASSEFKALKSDENNKQAEDLTNLILNFVNTAVVERVKNKQILISAQNEENIQNSFVKALQAAQQKQKEAMTVIKANLDTFFKGPLGTVAYINHRDPLGNYSEFKALYEQPNVGFLKPFSNVIVNAGFSFYHEPNLLMKQQKIRDFDFALSFEGKTASPFNETADLSQITYSFTGRYARMLENQKLANRKADLLMAQFLVNFPLFKGISLPFSVTYSNATEMERKGGVRVNFGLKLDTDKLLELTRINRRSQ